MPAGFNRLTEGGALSASAWNANLDAIELGNAASGRGIISGLDVTHVSGLTVEIAAGVLMGLKAASLPSREAVLPNDETVYLWIDGSGNVTTTTTPDYPGGHVVRLDRVTTAGGDVVSIDPASRVYVPMVDEDGVYHMGPGLSIDPLNGLVTLHGAVSHTGLQFETSGTFIGHSVRRAYQQETLSGDHTLTAASPRIQRLTASGANRKVILPDPSTLTFGDEPFQIYNDGASNNLLVRDHTDSTTLVTLAPGEFITPHMGASGGDPVWPSSGLTPGGGS
jgi:hypothetical protein